MRKPHHRRQLQPPLMAAFGVAALACVMISPRPVSAEQLPSEPVRTMETNRAPPSVPALDARAGYRALIDKEAAGTGLAPDIAEAVMVVVSGYNPAAIGGVGEIGLMQILPPTARMGRRHPSTACRQAKVNLPLR